MTIRRAVFGALSIVVGLLVVLAAGTAPAAAQQAPATPASTIPSPVPPTVPDVSADEPADDGASISLDLGGEDGAAPSQSIVIIIVLTLLSVAPALLMMLTSFTRIVIVLSLTRNALGVQNIPPNQVIVGLALFLSLFVMGPTLSQINENALQPLLDGEKTQEEAYDAAVGPMREFMTSQVDESELSMFVSATTDVRPKNAEDVSLNALIPAFILSEIKKAFIIGFIVFIPFLVIDLVVSSALMSMGMMMLPPVLVSLPFKLLLFVLVDGWDLVVRSLLTSFQ